MNSCSREHLAKDLVPLTGNTDPLDGWTLHNEGYRREVKKATTFVYYASSPSTVKAAVRPRNLQEGELGEVRAYGPGGSVIAYGLPQNMNPHTWQLVSHVLGHLNKQGKLEPF